MNTLRDRRARPILLTFGFVAALAWVYVVRGAGMDTGMSEMDMAGGAMMAIRPGWTVGYAALVFAMWVVMMAAMMLPSAAPAAVHAAPVGGRRTPPFQRRCYSPEAISQYGSGSARSRCSPSGPSTLRICCRGRWRSMGRLFLGSR